MPEKPIILVFYQNLRFHDQPLLANAIQQDSPIIPIFINDLQVITQLGAASQWWLHQSLVKFQEQWKSTYHIEFILRTGDTVRVLQDLIQETNAAKIYLGKRYTAIEVAIDKKIETTFTQEGIEVEFFNTHLLLEPATIRNQQGKLFQVFTPFWKFASTQIKQAEISIQPSKLKRYNQAIPSESLANWTWGHTQEAWTQKLAQYWQPTENQALDKLNKFSNELKGYDIQRNIIASPPFTSQLSPYLRWGQISVRKILKEITDAIQKDPTIQQDGNTFLSELGWREFSYYLLLHYPDMAEISLNRKFKNFPWQNDSLFLKKWQKGMTGYPIIDAGMRQLWKEGWIPNRLRMIVASFLIKDLFIDWQHGVAWFGDTLVDADPANNANSWQWVAGCGVDAAPYFRIFNPITQGQKFDPQGKYIKKYVPALKEIPSEYIHEPWKLPITLQERYGVILGKDYPYPIVDHSIQRDKALAFWQELKISI